MTAGRTTRRRALQAAALAAGAVPALAAGRAAATPLGTGGRIVRPLEAALDLTPNGVIVPGSAQDYRTVRAQPWWPPLRAVVRHLRMWADWPTLQPDPAFGLGDPRSPGHAALLALDDQVRTARADGLGVILMPYRYPPWVNGTAALAPGSPADLAHHAADRMGRAAWHALPVGVPPVVKTREYGLPADGHGLESAWGGFVAALLRRYVTGAAGAARATAIEVVNEPNYQLWPQRSAVPAGEDPFAAPGELTAHRAVAEMMVTVDTLARGTGVTCYGPSTADADVDRPRLVSGVREGFTDALLDELDRRGFGGGCHWIWSYHNYGDIERGAGQVAALRARLAGRWRGLQRDGGAAVAATEGGCRLSALGEHLSHAQRLTEQAARLARAVERHRDPADLGAGLCLLTQYTATADPNYDCALREADGGERPAFGAWCAALA